MWRSERNLNLEITQAKELLRDNPMFIMRDKYTRKPLGISYTEDGLRVQANKMGIYTYCKGRVMDLNSARTAQRNPNVVVERFIPREGLQGKAQTEEILWINKAKHMLGR